MGMALDSWTRWKPRERNRRGFWWICARVAFDVPWTRSLISDLHSIAPARNYVQARGLALVG